MATRDRVLAGLVLIALGLLLTALWLSPAPYLHDYAEWVYQSKILALKLTDPDSVRGFVLHPYPVPYMLSQYGMAILHLLLPPLLVGKLFILLYLIAAGAVCWGFTRRYIEEPAQRLLAWVLLVCVAGLSSFFWYGFIGYQLGLLVFVGFLSLYRVSSSVWLVALFAVAAFVAHATILIQLGLLVSLAVLFCRYPWQHLAGLVPAGLLSLWFLLGRYLNDTTMPGSGAAFSGILEAIVYKSGMLTMHGPFKNFLLPDGSALLENLPGVYWMGVAVNAAVIAVFGLVIMLGVARSLAGGLPLAKGSIDRRLLALFACCGIVLYLVGPFNFFGIVHPGARLILPFLFVGVALVYAEGLRLPATLAILVAIATAGNTLLYLLAVTSVESIPAVKPEQALRQSTGSVLAANRARYPNTRYTYYNYRVFLLSHRFAQLEAENYRGVGFPTGPLSHFNPALQKREH